MILRSVHSAVNHTPTHLLKEIILVDDNSDEGMGPPTCMQLLEKTVQAHDVSGGKGHFHSILSPSDCVSCPWGIAGEWGPVLGEEIQVNTS